MKRILIIGKKSFIGSNLKNYLSKNFQVDSLSFEKAFKKKNLFFDKYNYVINTSIHNFYIKKKYNKKFDLDTKFISKFDNLNFKYIFLNSRKIYFPRQNISENSKLKPIDNYSKNKLITENFLKKKIRENLVSLRISNIIGKRIHNNHRTTHRLFFDNFINYRKKKNKVFVANDFKDFISIDQFNFVIKKIIQSNVVGIYNVSISKKIYISELIYWLDKKFHKRIKFIPSKNDSFTLSNKKISKKIKIRLTKKQLELFCKKIFKVN